MIILSFNSNGTATFCLLRGRMKFWLNGLEDDETTMMNIDEKSAENLDILLHGFKGFSNKRVKG
ncbi:ANM_collapsed_G0058700.mRNA.1.CDS.1 [Saccharomyces cerevisiae]|nr:ANM_collapsed_G0058700.mRNA.1.CDS.1 [Saccharomyces cerevisiae]